MRYMIKTEARCHVFWLVLACLIGVACDAKAYLDPGSSSYAFQLLIAGVTALFFLFNSLKQRIGNLYRSLSRSKRSPEKETHP